MLSAQSGEKYGHLNRGNLIASLPETSIADSLLVTYRDSLLAYAKIEADQFQQQVDDYYEESQSGNLTPKLQQEREAALQKRNDELVGLEKTIVAAIQKRRSELFAPISKKVSEAIRKIGDAGNYTYIFDTSVFNALLFVNEQQDITEQVRAEL